MVWVVAEGLLDASERVVSVAQCTVSQGQVVVDQGWGRVLLQRAAHARAVAAGPDKPKLR